MSDDPNLSALATVESDMTCLGSECRVNRAIACQPIFIRVGLVMVAMLTFQAGPASANWQFDPIFRAAYDFDDNATLSGRTDEELELSGFIGEASVDILYDTRNGFFSLRPMLRTRNYGEEANRDSDDQFINLYAYRRGKRNSFQIIGDAARESVRTAELADADLDTNVDPRDIEDDQSAAGLSVRQTRDRYQVLPRWNYQFSDVSSFEAGLRYLTVDYEDQEGVVNLFDFTDSQVNLKYLRSFSRRNSGFLEVRGRDFNTDRFGGDRRSYALSTGFASALSQVTRLRVEVGLENVEIEDIGQGTITEKANPTFDISLVRRLKTIQLLAQYRQRINATGRGILTKRDEINLRFRRDLNELFSAGLGLRAYTDSTISGLPLEQDYVQLRGQVVWRLSRVFSIQMDYRHTVLRRAILEGAADSNRLTVWFSYQPFPVRNDPRLDLRF